MENCIFCKIIRGEVPAAKVWEDENFLAFLDIHPHTPGHTLVIPKKHIKYIFDMEEGDLSDLILACKPIAVALKKLFNPATGFVAMVAAGTGVPHVHIHLIPMNEERDINVESAKTDTPLEEIQVNAKKIRAEILGENP